MVDAETGNHIWAERFDKPIADLFDMQDEIVARLANQLQAELIGAEARRAEKTPNPDSVDLYFQGLANLNRGFSVDLLTTARGFYQFPFSLYCEKVRRALDYKGIGRTVSLLPGFHFRYLAKLAPETCVPVLRDGAAIVQDSSAIIDYLDRRYANPALTPSEPNAARACAYLPLNKSSARPRVDL